MARFDALLQAVVAVQADVVCLQELWFHPDTLGHLHRTLGARCVCTWASACMCQPDRRTAAAAMRFTRSSARGPKRTVWRHSWRGTGSTLQPRPRGRAHA
jgi:hypothetical protein